MNLKKFNCELENPGILRRENHVIKGCHTYDEILSY